MASCETIGNNVSQKSTPESAICSKSCYGIVANSDVAHSTPGNLLSCESGTTDSVAAVENETENVEHVVICVICLELVDNEASAFPCRHSHFHFSCLGTWLQQSRSCPLCKAEVLRVRYRDQRSDPINTFDLPVPDAASPACKRQENRVAPWNTRRRIYRREQRSSEDDAINLAIRTRRQVYERGLFSLYIGNNRISRYQNVTPALLKSKPILVSRAKKWIRRELSALDLPFQDGSQLCGSQTRRTPKFRNNEFLLEYIIAILKHIDLKGSAGQAEILLREHLGSGHARLFIHELENWLRSPFETLEDWDAFVQYPGHLHLG